MTGQYAEIEMPTRFALEVQGPNGDWFTEASQCSPSHFERQPDGSYLCGTGNR